MAAPVPTRSRLRLLYVGGSGRSGSTLLGRVLGEGQGAICVGETQYLWTRGLRENVRCGCGLPFAECSFWTAVGETGFGGWGRLDDRRVAALDRGTNRLRALPLHATPHLRPGLARDIADYTAVLGRLYRAIGEVSGARTVVEISKTAPFVSLLSRVEDLDLSVVHLVRDPRAVAHSWRRRRRMPSPIAGDHFMPRFPARVTAVNWLATNAALEVLSRRVPCERIAYEAFLEDPAAALGRLASLMRGALPLPARASAGFELGEHHIFSGNPMRERTGFVPLRGDGEWREGLSRRDFSEVTAITLPLLL